MTEIATFPPAPHSEVPLVPRKPRVWHLAAIFVLAQLALVLVTGIVIGGRAAMRGQAESASDPQQLAKIAEELSRSPEVILTSIATSVVLCTGLALLVGLLSPQRLSARLRLAAGRLSGVDVAVAAIGFLGYSMAADAVMRAIPGYDQSSVAQLGSLLRGFEGATFLLVLGLVGLGAPLGEELFYRGAIQTRLAERFGRFVGLFAASAAFAIAHMDPFHMVFALGAGLYLGWVADLAQSTRTSTVVHAVNNVASVLGAMVTGAALEWLNSLPVSVAAGLVALVCTAWLVRRSRTPREFPVDNIAP